MGDDDGRMVVSMRHPRDLIARVDVEARKTVCSRRVLIEHFIKWGCDARDRNRISHLLDHGIEQQDQRARARAIADGLEQS